MRVVGLLLVLVVLLAGCEGPPGPQGPQGDAGSALVEVRPCMSRVVSVGNASRLTFGYTLHRYADGSVMATCEVDDYLRSYGSVSLHRASPPGAVLGVCRLGYDVDVESHGMWEFTANDGVAYAAYSDPSSPSDKRVIEMTCSAT